MADMNKCPHGDALGYCRQCNPMPTEFESWISDLHSIAPHYADTGWEDWSSYFEDGYSPQQAIDEDLQHG